MGRPGKEIYQRDGIYYVRVAGHRWSTETGNEGEALRRCQFMKTRKKPWSDIKKDYGAELVITVDIEGNAHASLKKYFSDVDQGFKEFNATKIINRANSEKQNEPPKDCQDISILLDYEFSLKKDANKPAKTLEYYEDRFSALKRFVKKYDLGLNTFTRAMAIKYPQERLNETLRHKGEIGFNNRPATEPTINKEIPLFRGIWGVWKDENRVKENPWARVEALIKETGDVEEIEPDPYTLEEVALILKNVDDEVKRNVLLFQCMVGSRPGEEVLKTTKEAIEKNLIWNVKKRRWDQFTYSVKARDFYMKNLNGKMDGLNSAIIGKAFKKACSLAGVRIGKPYDLRKTFGTEALLDNRIETVQKMLRHKNLKTTRDHYAKTPSKELKKASEKMQRKIFRKIDP
jgi:integrase